MNLIRLAWPALALVSFAAGCGGQKADGSGAGGGAAVGGMALTGSGGTGAGGQTVIQPGDPGTTEPSRVQRIMFSGARSSYETPDGLITK